MGFVNTLIYSWKFLKQSAKFLRHNLDLLFFPIISLIAALSFLALTVFVSLIEIPLLEHIANTSIFLLIIIYGFIYFFLSFIVIYFNASLVACATLRLQGKDASIGDGLGLAAVHWWALIKWAIVGTTVGFIIRALENSHNILEDIVGAIIGVAWTVAAFFVIPVVIFENVGPFGAIKHSLKIFGRGWRKIISVHLIFSIFTVAIMGVIYGLIYLTPFESKLLIEFSFVVLALLILFMVIVGSTFNGIITSGLYLSIMQNKDPVAFDKTLLENAFAQRQNYQPRF